MEEEEVEVFTMSKDEIEPITDYLSKIEYFEEERKMSSIIFAIK